MFTLADKVLLDRAARLVLEQALAIEFSYGKPAWVGEEARKMKLIFDRHQRDARDLRALAKRMAAHFGAEPMPRKRRALASPGIIHEDQPPPVVNPDQRPPDIFDHALALTEEAIASTTGEAGHG